MRVLLCPIGSRGFVNPMLGIALRLRERRHQVAFATSADYEGVIAEAGFERVPRGNADGASFQLAIWAHPVSVSIQVRHVQYAVERFDPDVLLCSALALGPLIAGELAGLPVAVLGLAPYLWPVLVPGGATLSADHDAEWRHRETLALYNAARATVGLSALPASLDDSPLLGAVYLLQSVPELEPLAEHLQERVRFVGSCLYESSIADSEVAEWLATVKGRPLLYAHHGSVFRTGQTFWSGFVAARDELGISVAAAMERNRSAPPRSRDAGLLVRGYVPQRAVLERANGVVCSANTTAMLGALTHGLPALVFPTGGEQHALAARCLGVGAVISLSPSSSTADIAVALRRLLDDAGQERDAARRLKAAFAAYDGPGLVVAALEELAVPAVSSGVA